MKPSRRGLRGLALAALALLSAGCPDAIPNRGGLGSGGATTATGPGATTASGPGATSASSGSPTCGAGMKPCGAACAPQDPAHGCAAAACTPCTANHTTAMCTAAGECVVVACAPGYGDCDQDPSNGCETDLNSTPNHCGSCGKSCGAGSCNQGTCKCTLPQTLCNGVCVDKNVDPMNCGACGNACMAGDTCTGGACGCNGPMCGGTCFSADPSNCTACSAACPPGELCNAQTCSCPTGGYKCSAAEPCVNLSTDPLHCGGCNQPCTAGQICNGGSCICRSGLALCAGACADTLHDAMNCGGCGTVCPGSPARCTNGMCGTVLCGMLTPPLIEDNGGCYTQAQLESSPLACTNSAGPVAMGATCPANEVCVQGTCTAFFTSPGCGSCPCAACGSATTCCPQPGTMTAMCVTGTTCPQ